MNRRDFLQGAGSVLAGAAVTGFPRASRARGRAAAAPYRFPKDLYADVRLEQTFETLIHYRQGELINLRERRVNAAFVRLYDGQRWYLGAVADPDEVQAELDALAAMARPNPRIALDPLVARAQVNRGRQLSSARDDISRVGRQKKPALLQSYFPLLEASPHLKLWQALYLDRRSVKRLVSSKGADVSFNSQSAGLVVAMSFKDGERSLEEAWDLGRNRFTESFAAPGRVQGAPGRLRGLLGAGQTGQARQLHGHPLAAGRRDLCPRELRAQERGRFHDRRQRHDEAVDARQEGGLAAALHRRQRPAARSRPGPLRRRGDSRHQDLPGQKRPAGRPPAQPQDRRPARRGADRQRARGELPVRAHRAHDHDLHRAGPQDQGGAHRRGQRRPAGRDRQARQRHVDLHPGPDPGLPHQGRQAGRAGADLGDSALGLRDPGPGRRRVPTSSSCCPLSGAAAARRTSIRSRSGSVDPTSASSRSTSSRWLP